MAGIMRCSILVLLASVLGSVYLNPLDEQPDVHEMTTVDDSDRENLTTTGQIFDTTSVPTTTVEGSAPLSPIASHPVAPIVADNNPVTFESVLNSDTPTAGRPVMETSPSTIEEKRDVTQMGNTNTTASTAAPMSTTTTARVSTFAETTSSDAGTSTIAITNGPSKRTTADTLVVDDTTTAASTISAADTVTSASKTVPVNEITSAGAVTSTDTVSTASVAVSTTTEKTSVASTTEKSVPEGMKVPAERQGKSFSTEEKTIASTSRTTPSVPPTVTVTSGFAAEHLTKEEVDPRKPLETLVAQRQEEATSPADTESSESHSTETTLPLTVASTTLSLTSTETTMGSTSVTTATETRAGKALNMTIPPPQCAIILNSTLVQRRELFVPEELLSDTESLPKAFATGRVPQWAQEQCVAILTMLHPLNTTCEGENADRVSKFRSVALTAIWNYLCDRNATNLIAMANHTSTCFEGMSTLSKKCSVVSELGFNFHYPSELVLTPRVLKEGDCRNVNSTNTCLKEQISGMQSSCAAAQMNHMVALLDLLLKSVKCDQVPPTPAPPKSAATHTFYSLWSLVLAVVLAGFYW